MSLFCTLQKLEAFNADKERSPVMIVGKQICKSIERMYHSFPLALTRRAEDEVATIVRKALVKERVR